MVTYYVVMQLSGGDLMRWKWFLLAAAFFYTTAAEAGEALSHYTGQEKREIKALSKEEIDGYISGDGMGFAKTAELKSLSWSQARSGPGGSTAAFR
jgi:hypothetical protein